MKNKSSIINSRTVWLISDIVDNTVILVVDNYETARNYLINKGYKQSDDWYKHFFKNAIEQVLIHEYCVHRKSSIDPVYQKPTTKNKLKVGNKRK